MASANQTAIVTGAASGIGRAMALGLLGAALDVVAVDRTAPALQTLASEAQGKPGTIHTVHADLSDPASFDRIVATSLEKSGRIDILVNNAGIGQASVRPDRHTNPIRYWEVTPEQWQRFVAVNATAPIMMARAVLPHMRANNRGRIVTVTTSLGTMVREGYLLYGASKAAAEAAMASLSGDLKGSGITCNVLVPGGVTNTGIVGDDAGDRSKMLQPEIMVPPLLWLLSDAAAGVNGRRFIAADWDTALPEAQAADNAGAPIAWMSIARMPIEPPR
jgi:NAD(P)-dependent dehydrogenase (short-subunit alcohol dehydrogenase family)